MKNTIVIYGSTTGTCEEIAQTIAQKLDVKAIAVTEMTTAIITANDNLILGTSTWGAGEMQDDWYDGIKILGSQDLSSKTVAVFGCGDSASYGDTFCGGIAEIYLTAKEKGAKMIGEVSTEGYAYDASDAEVDGKFIGLPLDEINESNQTNARIEAWLTEIKPML